jgi:hypothetical protein
LNLFPTTDLGRWAVGLAATFLALVLAASIVPSGAALGLVSGLAAGIAALLAILRDGERAVSAFVALVPLLIAVGFVVAELLSGA